MSTQDAVDAAARLSPDQRLAALHRRRPE